MLLADQIEHAILTIVLEKSSAMASFPTVIGLAKEIERRIGSQVTDREVTAALLDAHDSGLINIGRYVGDIPVPLDRSKGDDYFYQGEFYFFPEPKAHRRQQELSRDNRLGIFISHINEEKPIALLLQLFLQECLPNVPVFVSSDRKSIDSGDQWYESILSGLRKSNVVIILLSKASIDRRWINFEAGFGMGQNSRVIPLVCRGLDKNDVGLPLGQLQARDLQDKDDVAALIGTAARECNVLVKQSSIPDLIAKVADIESSIPASDLQVKVYREQNQVKLTIRNNGNRPLEMVDAELLLPKSLCTANLGDIARPVRERIYGEEGGVSMIGYRLTTHPSPIPHLGVDSLRPFLDSAMGDINLDQIALPLNKELTEEDNQLPIRFRVCSKAGSVASVLKIGQLPTR